MKPLYPDVFVMDSHQSSSSSPQRNAHPYTWPTPTMMLPGGDNASNTSTNMPPRGMIPLLDQWSLHQQALSSWALSPGITPLMCGTLSSKYSSMSPHENLPAIADHSMQQLSTQQAHLLSEHPMYSSGHQVHASGHQVYSPGHQGHSVQIARRSSTNSIASLRLKAVEYTATLQKGVE